MTTHSKLFLLAILPLSADQITFKNGDRISGKIVRKAGDKVILQATNLGEVTASWESIASVTSDDPVTVVLPDGRAVSGRLNTSGANLEVATATGIQTAVLATVPTLRNVDEQRRYEALLEPGPLELWAGYFDLGYALSRGNARTDTLTTAFNAARATRNDKTAVYFNQIYAKARVADIVASTAEAMRGGWTYDRTLTQRLLLNVLNDYEQNNFLDLDLRFVLGGGVGLATIRNERTRLDLFSGAAYNREKFSNLTRNSAELYWGNDWSYAMSGVTSLRQNFRMFHNMSNTGEYRMNFDLGAVTSINKWLAWQVTASDRFLSNPVLGRQRNDMLVTTGLRLNFSRAPR